MQQYIKYIHIIFFVKIWYKYKTLLPCCGEHSAYGFPINPIGHEHLGVWLITVHSALGAQAPTQGFLHFMFMQYKWVGHSLLLTHSGLQFGGEPIKSGKQEHDGDWPWTLHCEFGPQGDGTQGFPTGCGISAAIII